MLKVRLTRTTRGIRQRLSSLLTVFWRVTWTTLVTAVETRTVRALIAGEVVAVAGTVLAWNHLMMSSTTYHILSTSGRRRRRRLQLPSMQQWPTFQKAKSRWRCG
jgi:hypothetical protein